MATSFDKEDHKMKKTLSLIISIILFGGFVLQAAPVSRSQALKVAKAVFEAQPATKAGGRLEIVWDGEEVATKGVQPAFYVIARSSGGFVIVSGDDNVRPILGLSANGCFETENMPENVKWWMDRMKDYVRSVNAQSSDVKEQWSQFAGTKANASVSGTITDKVEKLTPEWDQGNNDPRRFGEYVFNTACPQVDNEYCLVGCVAVALGEVLTYESGQPGVEMPSQASGTVGGYSAHDGYVAPAQYTLNATYDWENLRTLTGINAILNTASGSPIRANLARLLADLGAIIEAEYSVTGTGADHNDVDEHMIEHFGLNKAVSLKYATNYTSSQWVEMLRAEIDKRPVLFSGRAESNSIGHSFVLDGYGTYKGETVFHVNFGWGGWNNGYYYITNMDAGESHNYSYRCSAFFDFYPDPDSEYPADLGFIQATATIHGVSRVFNGLSSDRTISYNQEFLLSIGGIYNYGKTSYSGEIWIARESLDGTYELLFPIQVLADGDPNNPPLSPGSYRYYCDKCVQITGRPFSFGEHLSVYYSANASKTVWKKIPTPAGGRFVGDLPLLPAAFIYTESSYSQGGYFAFRLINNDTAYSRTNWTITYPDGEIKVYHQQASDGFRLTKTGKYKIEAEVIENSEKIVTYITVN